MQKLITDITLNWFKYQFISWKLLLSNILLIIPLCFILNLKAIESTFLSTEFTSIKNTEIIHQIFINDKTSNLPVDKFIFDELHNQFPYLVGMFERTLQLSTKKAMAEEEQAAKVSFVSNTIGKLDIDTHLGSLRAFSMASTGSSLITAVSFTYWKNNLNSDPTVIDKQIIINGKSTKIVAVLNAGFKSLRRDSSTDLLLPYHQLSELLPNEQELTPDTFTYVLGNITDVESFVISLDAYLKKELFIFDNTKLMVSKSVGVDPEQFQTVSKRVDLLAILFGILFVFSLISFSAFYAAQCINKKKEVELRKLCGANEKHIILQRYIEVGLLACYLVFMLVIFTPLTSKLAYLTMPIIGVFNVMTNIVTLITLLVGFILYLMVLNFLQEKTTITHIGRGSSASLSEKVQVFTLLSLLISLAILSLYVSYLVIISQTNLNKHKIGFEHKNLYIASFDFPSSPEHSFIADNSAQQLLLQLNSLDYIESAALTNVPPLTDRSAFSRWYTLSGKPVSSSKNAQTSNHRVSPNYFDTIGTRLIVGNSLSWGQYRNIVVNQALWEQYFADTGLGQAYLLTDFGNEKVKYKVVGVVDNIHIKGSDTPVQPTVYTLISVITGFESIVFKSKGGLPTNLTQEMMSITKNISPYLKNLSIVELSELVKKEAQPRKAILVITITCSVVLLVSALLYCFNSIKQLAMKSATEISLKRALGARTKNIGWSFGKFYFIIQGIVHFIILACVYFNMSKLQPFLFKVDLIDIPVITLLHFAAFSILIVVFFLEIKNILNKSWQNLS
ncbi:MULTISPECIES: ABC transporter permease [Pseudoalteromonas]|uniref:ABC transporter permease n=1 Tax=Pseudoalteromonas TaxID=53246 RepID=UPI0003015678|nr:MULTISPECIES: ABC transporter permease [Pseudoalteromonas]MCF6144465.1 hypothetical protein [Pseudoalteromonas mariniglutinosa NCIMB 1770]